MQDHTEMPASYLPDSSTLLAKRNLRLQIVEEALITFLVSTLLASGAVMALEPALGALDIALSFGPFLAINLACLWMARRGRLERAAWLYTFSVAVMQGSSVLIFGGVPVHVMLSMVNLVLLIGISAGARPAMRSAQTLS